MRIFLEVRARPESLLSFALRHLISSGNCEESRRDAVFEDLYRNNSVQFEEIKCYHLVAIGLFLAPC